MEQERDYDILFNYAFCGGPEGFEKMLNYLADIAEQEVWTMDDEKPNSILKSFIIKTFSQCKKQEKVIESKDGKFACFNTGLLTSNGNDIIALFEKNDRVGVQPWILKKFVDKCHRDFLDVFSNVPELASYTNDYKDLYFNPDYNIIMNLDHILDDNWERIGSAVPYSKSIMKTLLFGVVEEAKIKIKRNIRLVVPQYYRDEIMYLVPIRIPIDDEEYITMALAVEKTETNQYRANTIFTKEIAYEKARLLMKPESNWLVE